MSSISFSIERLSDVFQPRKPLVANVAEPLRFVFHSTRSGLREREVTLHAVSISNDGNILFKCMCHETEEMKTFRTEKISSKIECRGQAYEPAALLEHLGVPLEALKEEIKKAHCYKEVRENFDEYFAKQLGSTQPLWTGGVQLEFKALGKKHIMTMNSIYVLPENDVYLWGFIATKNKIGFIPFSTIEGKITTDGHTGLKKTFLRNYLPEQQ